MNDKFLIAVIAGTLSLSIACLGWFLLYKRTNKMARRSETFSLISEIISIIQEFESIAEEQLKQFIDISEVVGPNTLCDTTKRMKMAQLMEGKFLIKFKLFRQRLKHLEKRHIFIKPKELIEIKKAMTSGSINTTEQYQIVLNSTQCVHSALYDRFEDIYKPFGWDEYILRKTTEKWMLFLSIPFLFVPLTPGLITLYLK